MTVFIEEALFNYFDRIEMHLHKYGFIKMTKKIVLSDLAYIHEDEYIHPVPLNVGYIGAYLLKYISSLEIKIVKNPIDLLQLIDNYDFHYIAMSNYDWNMNLNKQFIQLILKKKPETIIIMGGPNIDSDTDEHLLEFFNFMKGLNYYIIGEGEERFRQLMEALITTASGQINWDDMSSDIVGYNMKQGTIIRGKNNPVPPCDLSIIPSPYLTGLLDSILIDPRWVPMMETSRGCPYSCAYCCWGNATNSTIRPFPVDIVYKEIDYIAQKSKNPIKSLYICDSNFGIFSRDVQIAMFLKKSYESKQFPRCIYAYFSKKTNKNVIEIANYFKGLTNISMSKQSLNNEVLAIIGRKNIPDESYKRLHTLIIDIGIKAFCELIYALPGETLDSFLDGFEKMLMMNVDALLYPLLLIKGTRINTDHFKKQYNIQSKYRIIPRYVGSYGPIHSLEYEEVVVSHSKLSYEDFHMIRLVQFFYYIFSEKIFIELKQFLFTNKKNIVAFIRYLIVKRQMWPNSVQTLIHEFQEAAKTELLDPQDLTYQFSKKYIHQIQSNGRALNIFYFCKLIAKNELKSDFKTLLLSTLINFFDQQNVIHQDIQDILTICFDKIPSFPDIIPQKQVAYPYDVDLWIHKNSNALKDYRLPIKKTYVLNYDLEYIKIFNKLLDKYKDTVVALYWLRMNFIVNTFMANTYIRKEIK